MREKKGIDYSTFGAPMVGRQYQSTGYRYGFNGQEKDDEMHNNSGDSYDFGARIYDARLGRFLSQDKFANKYPELTPYNYVGNNPIAAIDIGGDSIYVLSSDGKLYNVSTETGRDLAKQYGGDVLMRTVDGAELVNKYANSSSYDVYIGTADQSLGNDGALTSSTPLTAPSGNTGDIRAVGKGAPLNKFSNMEVKNSGNQFALMLFNPDYVNRKGIYAKATKYDMAETFYHELKAHIDYQTQSKDMHDLLVKQNPSKADIAGGIGKIQHYLYGVDHENNMFLNAPNIRKGSDADNIRKQLNAVKKWDESSLDLGKKAQTKAATR